MSMALSASATCVSCKSASGAPNKLRVAARSIISSNARRAGNGRAEDIERRHRHLEAFAGAAETIGQRDAAGGEATRRERVWSYDLNAAGDRKTRGISVDDETGKPLGTGGLAGPREHHVVVRDSAIGDPGLEAVNAHVRRPIFGRGRRQRADVGPRFGFRERECRDMTAIAHRRQIFSFDLVAAEQRYRGRPQSLHGERKISEAVVPGENLTRGANRAHVELFREAAIGFRHDGLEPAGIAQSPNERPAGLIHVGVIDVPADFLVSPIRERRAKLPVFLAEKRPRKMSERRHQRSPPFRLSPLSRSKKRWTFPVAVFGRLSTNSIQRGYFQGPIARFTCTLSSS